MYNRLSGSFLSAMVDMRLFMSTLTSIAYLQFIRFNCHCSDKFTFDHLASNIFHRFVSNDYLFKLICSEFTNVCHIDHNNVLKYYGIIEWYDGVDVPVKVNLYNNIMIFKR